MIIPPTAITSFTGEHRFLSNFWGGTPFAFGGRLWPTAEHAYQAAKTNDLAGVNWIADAPTPGEAKRRGRRVAMRPDWDQEKRGVMLMILLAKFDNTTMAERLTATRGHTLIEGNTWGDYYWGAVQWDGRVTPDLAGLRIWDVVTGHVWIGRNWLGRLLMMTRDVLDDDDLPGYP